MEKRNNTGEGKEGENKMADSKVPPATALPVARTGKGESWGGPAGSTVSRSYTGGSEEPACTKLMGNCSVWLLPSLEQGLKGEGGGGPRDGRQHGVNQTLPINSDEDSGGKIR